MYTKITRQTLHKTFSTQPNYTVILTSSGVGWMVGGLAVVPGIPNSPGEDGGPGGRSTAGGGGGPGGFIEAGGISGGLKD